MTHTLHLRSLLLLGLGLTAPRMANAQENPTAKLDSPRIEQRAQMDSYELTIRKAVRKSSHLLPLVQVWERHAEPLRPSGMMPAGDSLLQRTQPNSDLGRDLQWTTPLAIHSRGPGQLSTLAAAGLPGTHLMVNWEGMSLVNPMHHTPDMALMPSWLLAGAQVEPRAAGGRIGGGSGGGVLWVPGDLKEGDAPVRVFLSAGSFGARSGGLGATLRRGALGYSMRAYTQHCDLDFPYPATHSPESPRVRRRQSAQSGAGLRQSLSYQAGRHAVRLGHWLQMHERQIPVALTAAPGRAEQHDTLHRIRLNWNHNLRRRLLWGNLGLSREINRYSDSATAVFGRHLVEGVQGWLGWRRDYGWGWLTAHGNLQKHRVVSTAYPGRVHQSRLGLQAQLGRMWGRHSIRLAARVEQVDGRWLPPVPEVSWEWTAGKGESQSLPSLKPEVAVSALTDSHRASRGWRASGKGTSQSLPSLKPEVAVSASSDSEGVQGGTAAGKGSSQSLPSLKPEVAVSALTDSHRVSRGWTASLSGLQRIPGLNDLYWQPGGRPDLGYEQGWSVQAGRQFTRPNPGRKSLLRCGARLYVNHLLRQIVWLPDATLGYWRPTSLQETRSGGLQADAFWRRNLRESILELHLQYAYTRSLQYPDRRPLPYLPPHVLLTGVRWMHPRLYTDLRVRMVDRRSDAFDPGDSRLHPYACVRLGAGWQLPGPARRWNLSVAVENLFNARYELVPYHPMPGRQFTCSLLFE